MSLSSSVSSLATLPPEDGLPVGRSSTEPSSPTITLAAETVASFFDDRFEPSSITLSESGCYLIELACAREAPADVVSDALDMIGLDDAILDRSRDDGEHAWGMGDGQSLLPFRARAVARCSNPLRLTSTEEVAWIYASKLLIDPFADSASAKAVRLERGKTYDLRLNARLPASAKSLRIHTLEQLSKTGFDTRKLSLIRTGVRMGKGRTEHEASRWVARAVWVKADSYALGDEHVFIEEASSWP